MVPIVSALERFHCTSLLSTVLNFTTDIHQAQLFWFLADAKNSEFPMPLSQSPAPICAQSLQVGGGHWVMPVPGRERLEYSGTSQNSKLWGLVNVSFKIQNGTQKWNTFPLRLPTTGECKSQSILDWKSQLFRAEVKFG